MTYGTKQLTRQIVTELAVRGRTKYIVDASLVYIPYASQCRRDVYTPTGELF